VPAAVAAQVSHLPPVSTVFAALLGFNPVQHLLAPSGVLATLPRHSVAVLTGNQFFPRLISAPFHQGLIIVFIAAALMSVTGAVVSLLRGGQFYYEDGPASGGTPAPAAAGRPGLADGTAPNGQAAPAGSPAPLPRGSGVT
jgi:hypothetical protein